MSDNKEDMKLSFVSNLTDCDFPQSLGIKPPTSPNECSRVVQITDLHNRKDIDRLFFDLNKQLNIGDSIVISFMNLQGRRMKLCKAFTPILGFILYYSLVFFFYRILARLKMTRKLFLFLSNGKNQAISTAEGLGRVISCNFKIISYESREGTTYLIGEKVEEVSEIPQSSQGIVIGLKRVGYQGKIIKIWKIRSMRPYSEFLQSFLWENHGTDDGDKIINDFRIARWGAILRKFWIDELPMIWNLINGDLKLVGVRPLSQAKFQVYPIGLQKLRIQVKPGLLPPYYADLPKNPEEFFKSEEVYTRKYLKNPIKTDVTYFFKILYNIIIKGTRSA